MKISVDGGGLAAEKPYRYGNYIFSKNLIKALRMFDKKNRYYIYTFDNLKPRFLWMKARISLEEFLRKKEVFLALNQAIPLFVSGKVISFCHGLSYYFYPQYYSKKDNNRLRNQLEEMTKRSDIIVVSSEKVKKELARLTEKKVIVIPFGIPFDMSDQRLLRRFTPRNDSRKYFLYVGMNHPIKNIQFIMKVFRKFREFSEFKSYELKIITKNCPRNKLKNLYQGAIALLTASHYESFNLPVLETLVQGTPVIGLKSAIIPELFPFVNLAKNEVEFLNLMKKIANTGDRFTLIKHLIKVFSWKNYVKKLIKLY